MTTFSLSERKPTMTLRIVTNHHLRPILHGFDIPPSVSAEFDYLSPEDFPTHPFVAYRGNWYDLSDFMRIPTDSLLADWDGVLSESCFSGVLIKLSPYDGFVKLARYFE